MIGLCTDSSALVPQDLRERYGIEIVPGTVIIGEVEQLDEPGHIDAYYERFLGGSRARADIVEPSSGQFAAAYEDLIARGCTEILSLHSGAAVNNARLAAHATAVPVKVLDPATVGFGLACAAWAAGESVSRGASLDQVVTVAERIALQIDNVFIVGASDSPPSRIALINYRLGEPQLVDRFETVFDAINGLATRVVSGGARLRVAVGHSDASSMAIADAIADAVGGPANVVDLVRYRIGPSAGGQALPGTVGCYSFPAD